MVASRGVRRWRRSGGARGGQADAPPHPAGQPWRIAAHTVAAARIVVWQSLDMPRRDPEPSAGLFESGDGAWWAACRCAVLQRAAAVRRRSGDVNSLRGQAVAHGGQEVTRSAYGILEGVLIENLHPRAVNQSESGSESATSIATRSASPWLAYANGTSGRWRSTPLTKASALMVAVAIGAKTGERRVAGRWSPRVGLGAPTAVLIAFSQQVIAGRGRRVLRGLSLCHQAIGGLCPREHEAQRKRLDLSGFVAEGLEGQRDSAGRTLCLTLWRYAIQCGKLP